MTKPTGPTNPYLKKLIDDLRKISFEKNTPIWKRVAKELAKSRRRKVEVNLSDIDRHTEKNEIVVVPGVVLSSGELSKPVTIAAWRFSHKAKEKVKKTKGKTITIEELLKKNPKGTNVKIMV